MYKYLHLLLKQHLKAAIPELKEVGWYRGQDNPAKGKGTIRILPAVYIAFKPTDMRSLANGVQEGNVEFDLILLTDCLNDEDKSIDDTTSIDHMDLVNLIHIETSGFSGKMSDITAYASLLNTDADVTIANTIDRIKIVPFENLKAMMKTTQTFTTYVKDYTGNKAWIKVVKGLEILSN